MLFTMVSIYASPNNKEIKLFELYDQLVEARRALSLFQHHDGTFFKKFLFKYLGVAGTAKAHVVIDYAMK